MYRKLKSSRPKTNSFYLLAAFVIIFAGLGTKLIFFSHADSPGASQTDCFASPGSCGYPDPSYNGGNVGQGTNCSNSALPTWSPSDLPNGDYSSSGAQVNITGNNVTVSGYKIIGYFFYIEGSHFTLNDDCMSFDGTLWGGGQSSSTAVWGTTGATYLTVENSTIEGANSTTETDETLITNGGQADGTIENNVLINAVEDINSVGPGTVIQNNYIYANGVTGGDDHSEDLDQYNVGAQVTIDHNTMLNPLDQSGVIFDENDSSCTDVLGITNNLMAGGGWPLNLCVHSTAAGTHSFTIENNAFARCEGSTASSLGGNYCTDAPLEANGSSNNDSGDGHGYWPDSGFFGFSNLTYFSTPTPDTWCGNYWDDASNNSSFINDDGSSGGSACASTPSISFSASSPSINSGSSTSLNWSTTNATACSPVYANWINPSSPGSGSQSVSPTTTTTYTLSCTGASGTTYASTTVTVTQGSSPASISSFTASPGYLINGSSSTLSWTTANATSCTASSSPADSGWNSSVATSGTATVTPPVPTGTLTGPTSVAYTLTCSGSSGPNASNTIYITDSDKLGDLNNDDSVNIFDLSIFLSHYGESGVSALPEDLNADGTVNVFDLSIFLSHWGS